MDRIILALAPVFIIALYVYFRDKYEKEPIGMLLKALGFGMIIVIPVGLIEGLLVGILPLISGNSKAFYNAFIVAGLTEELFKFFALFILIWANRNFNEKFDGIIYAVFISLGFAAVENIIYVSQFGSQVGYIRAISSVPAHALFGIIMGYYFGLARFRINKNWYITRSLIYPVILHGIFDFILMMGNYFLLLIFIPYVIFLYIFGMKKMNNLSKQSIITKVEDI
jgi:RsiW-degrading membrane proteinase PrsW (M82 family)